MTVTFTAAHVAPIGYAVSCCCPQATARAPRFGSYLDAQEAADRANAASHVRRPLPGCELPEICPEYPLDAEEVDPDGVVPSVEFSNSNVVSVLEALGFSVDPDAVGGTCDALEDGLPLTVPDDVVLIPIAPVDAYGQLPAEDFRARVLTALGFAPEDPGLPDLQLGRTIIGGRPAGYLQRRLRELYELADWCVAHGRDVTWH